MKIQKKELWVFVVVFFLGGGGRIGGGGVGRAGGVRVDVNEELKFLRKFTKKLGGGYVGGCSGWGCSGWGECVRVGGQGGCERRIEVFVKIQKKMGGEGGRVGGSGWGVRVDVNEELKFLGRFTKKWGGGREGGSRGGVRWGDRVGGGGVRVDVNAMLGVEGVVGNRRFEPRIEGIVQCTKRYCTILRKIKKNVGLEGEGQYLNPKHYLCI